MSLNKLFKTLLLYQQKSEPLIEYQNKKHYLNYLLYLQ
jgi:hypothetical protein